MTRRRVFSGLAAGTGFLSLIWWTAWCKHSLDGWTAVPIYLSVGLPLYAGVLLLVILATSRRG